MSTRIPRSQVEQVVGARRHQTLHIARWRLDSWQLCILHPEVCKVVHADLRDCPLSLALDHMSDADGDHWPLDEPVFVVLNKQGKLEPWTPGWTTPDKIIPVRTRV